jgi:hypothetical protein
MDALLSSAAAHERAARAALARGDWSTFGSEMDALQADLDSLTRATGAPGAALPHAAPAPSVTMPAATPAAMP